MPLLLLVHGKGLTGVNFEQEWETHLTVVVAAAFYMFTRFEVYIVSLYSYIENPNLIGKSVLKLRACGTLGKEVKLLRRGIK